MATPILPIPTPHPWSKGAYLAKAKRYADQMQTHAEDGWLFVFWSALTLEHVARAALAHVNQALLADTKGGGHAHLFFALGITPRGAQYLPKSIEMSSVIERLGELVVPFDGSLRGFATKHIANRNEELHSGSTPFDNPRTDWLPSFYDCCDVLLVSMGETLELLVGNDRATAARTLIAAKRDASAQAVRGTIHQHSNAWAAMPEPEKELQRQRAALWASRHTGHRVACPACQSNAVVTGEAAAPPIVTLRDDEIVVAQTYLPTTFECIACGLKILGPAKIQAAGLGATFTSTLVYSVAEYYAGAFEPDSYSEPDFEPDYND